MDYSEQNFSQARSVKVKRRELTKKEVLKIDHDLRILEAFTHVYCPKKHGTPKNILCPECSAFLDYAKARRIKCPLDPKPKCKECPVHCYAPKMRERVREVMRVGGMHFILSGRLDWAVRYLLFSRKGGPA